MLERSQSLLQCYNNNASLQDWMDPILQKADEAKDGSGEGLQPRYRHCKPDVNTRTLGEERAQKQTIVSVDSEHRDGCAC